MFKDLCVESLRGVWYQPPSTTTLLVLLVLRFQSNFCIVRCSPFCGYGFQDGDFLTVRIAYSFSHILKNTTLVAGPGIAPGTEAYETSEILLLQPAIVYYAVTSSVGST